MAILTAGEFAIPSGAPSGGDQDMISFDGIGIDNTTKKVTINKGAVAGGDLEVKSETTGTTLFADVSTGFVTIGGAAPTYTGNYTSLISVEGSNFTGIAISSDAVDDNQEPLGQLAFVGKKITDADKRAAAITVLYDGTPAGDKGGRLNFQLRASGGSVPVNQMTIRENGNVGFGTDSPNFTYGGDRRVITLLDTVGEFPVLEMATDKAIADTDSVAQIFGINTNGAGNGIVGSILIKIDGTTANAGGKIQFNTRKNSTAVNSINTEINEAGKLTHNFSALAGGDFEVLSQTSGTTLFADVSLSQVYIGAGVGGAPSGSRFYVNGGSTTNTYLERNSAITNTRDVPLRVAHKTSGNMLDDFGTEISFVIEDGTASEKIGGIAFVRDSDDIEGQFEVYNGTNGAERSLYIKSDLQAHVASKLSINADPAEANTQLYVAADAANTNWLDVVSSNATGILNPLTVRHKTTVNRTGDFGTAIDFQFKDDTADNSLGRLVFQTDGADTSGKFIVQLNSTNQAMFSIDSNGKFTSNLAAIAGGDFEVLKQTSGTLLFADVSANRVNIGADSISTGAGTTVLAVDGGNIFANAIGGASLILRREDDASQTSSIVFRSGGISGNNETVVQMLAYQDGVTAGNEGGLLRVFLKDDGASSQHVAFRLDEDGTTAFNTDSPDALGLFTFDGGTIVQRTSTDSFIVQKTTGAVADGELIGGINGLASDISGASGTVAGMLYYVDGATAGNEGGELRFRTKLNGAGTINEHVSIDNAGKTIVNFSALAGGDFEILKETSGQLALFDVSAGEVFLNLPTSAGTAGSLWNDAGTVKVA